MPLQNPKPSPGPRTALLAALVFLVACNLRPAITAVGPVLPQLSNELRLGEAAQGLLGALPLLAFAAVSPLVHRISRRLGIEGAILMTMVLLSAGALIRSYTGFTGLWLGTVIIGAAIGIGNVLVPTLVKRDYSLHISRATGILSACMTALAATGSAIAVPMADAVGWRGALAFWAVPAAVVALVWILRIRHATPVPPEPEVATGHGVWRQPTAWLVTAFMGLQSTTFYFFITWMPTIESLRGVSDQQSGINLFIYQIAGMVAAISIPRLMRGTTSQTAATVTASLPMIIGLVGLLTLPEFGFIWALIAGAGTGACLSVALSLISLRGRTNTETTQLSGMAQSVGYLMAAVGPLLAGALAQLTGGWTAPLAALLAIATAQLAVAVAVGRDRRASA